MTRTVSFTSKGEMLDAIKSHLNMSKNADFARFLGISSQAVSNWYTRNTFDAELLYTKCDFINPAWLLTGKGSMLKDDLNNIKSIPLHDRLSFLIEATNDVHVVAQSLGIEETSLLNCTNNFLEPKEEIDFNKFLTEFPEFSKQWLLQGIGTPFDGKELPTIRAAQESIQWCGPGPWTCTLGINSSAPNRHNKTHAHTFRGIYRVSGSKITVYQRLRAIYIRYINKISVVFPV